MMKIVELLNLKSHKVKDCIIGGPGLFLWVVWVYNGFLGDIEGHRSPVRFLEDLLTVAVGRKNLLL